jgi:hypothetical protein
MGRETVSLQLLAPLLLTGGKGADLVIRGNVVLNKKKVAPVAFLNMTANAFGPARPSFASAFYFEETDGVNS